MLSFSSSRAIPFPLTRYPLLSSGLLSVRQYLRRRTPSGFIPPDTISLLLHPIFFLASLPSRTCSSRDRGCIRFVGRRTSLIFRTYSVLLVSEFSARSLFLLLSAERVRATQLWRPWPEFYRPVPRHATPRHATINRRRERDESSAASFSHPLEDPRTLERLRLRAHVLRA